MRLLRYDKEGNLILTKYFADGDQIPRYAILSHTWIEDNEITLQDLQDGIRLSVSGFRKIKNFAKQAHSDGFDFFWVDTCCIDKSDAAEFQHAIKSMFQWYQNAARCYVYLSDVRKPDAKIVGTEDSWHAAFRSSRWFTRGWTLQELLAPALLVFYGRDWQQLGDRKSLQQKVHEITAIPHQALQGRSILKFSIEERLRWGHGRQTKLEEDKAYSLVGLFGVDLAPVYGIGFKGAFQRLQREMENMNACLQDLYVTDPRDDKRRIEDTKGGLVEDASEWIWKTPEFQQWYNEERHRMLWIRGDPGKGKTMLVCSIVDALTKSQLNTDVLAFFFCQAMDNRLNSALAVLRGLLHMILEQKPSLTYHLRTKYDRAGRKVFEDANAWLTMTAIFTDVLEDPQLPTTYLLVDGLDECDRDLRQLLNFISRCSSLSNRVRWLISSRNWPDIQSRLASVHSKIGLSLELNARHIAAAVKAFIHHKVAQLARKQQYDQQTRLAVYDYVSANSQDTFLWVALMFQSLIDVRKRHIVKKLKAIPAGLDALYERMMQQMSKEDDADICKRILAIAAAVYRPVTLHELGTLLELESSISLEDLTEIIGLCGSFLTIRKSTVYFVHQSAAEFISTTAACTIYPLGTKAVHRAILFRSLDVMFALRRDMYDLRHPGFAVVNVVPPTPDPLLGLHYSCSNWVDHLCELQSGREAEPELLEDGSAIHEFLRWKYPYWLESLSLGREISKGCLSMVNLAKLVKERASGTELRALIYDAKRILSQHRHEIATWPLQTYACALMFSPPRSPIRQLFQRDLPPWLTTIHDAEPEWTFCLQTLEGHTDTVVSIMFSYDSRLLVSTSLFEAIIWDTATGKCLHTFKPDRYIYSSTFSHDATKVAAVLDDFSIQIWNATDGSTLAALPNAIPDRTDIYEASITLSHDSDSVAATSGNLIAIWSMRNCKCMHVLEGHEAPIISVAFSQDSKLLRSAARDRTIRTWDVQRGVCLQKLECVEQIETGAFSSDAHQYIASSFNRTFKINLTSSDYSVLCEKATSLLDISPDSTTYATLSRRGDEISIWDVSTGSHLQDLDCQRIWAHSFAFSHDSMWFATGANNGEVKIWDLSSGVTPQSCSSQALTQLETVSLGKSTSQLALRNGAVPLRIWNISGGSCITVDGRWERLVYVDFSPNQSTPRAAAAFDWMSKFFKSHSLQQRRTNQNQSPDPVSIQESSRLVTVSEEGGVQVWLANSIVLSQERFTSTSNLSHITLRDGGTGRRVLPSNGDILLDRKASQHNSALANDKGSTVEIVACRTRVQDQNLVNTSGGLSTGWNGSGIGYNSELLLWLPSKYRLTYGGHDVFSDVVAVVDASKRLWMYKFDLEQIHALPLR